MHNYPVSTQGRVMLSIIRSDMTSARCPKACVLPILHEGVRHVRALAQYHFQVSVNEPHERAA